MGDTKGADFILGDVGLKPKKAVKIHNSGELDIDAAVALMDERVRREALKAAAKAADAETEPAGPMPHCPPEWSVEDVVRAAVRATRQAIAGRIRALAEVKP